MRKRPCGDSKREEIFPKMKDIFVHKYFKGSRTWVFGFHLLVNSRKLNFNWCLHNVMILPPATFPHCAALLTPWIKHSTCTGWYSFLLWHPTVLLFQVEYVSWNHILYWFCFKGFVQRGLQGLCYFFVFFFFTAPGDCYLLIFCDQPQNLVVAIIFIVYNKNILSCYIYYIQKINCCSSGIWVYEATYAVRSGLSQFLLS